MCFSIRPTLRKNINSLNALIMLWSSTSRHLREHTIHDNSYPIYEKKKHLQLCLPQGINKLRVTQSTTSAFEYIYGV